MTTKTPHEAPAKPTIEHDKICLAYASLLWLAVRQALRASGAAKDPERLAKLEAQLEAGEANLGIWVQGDATRIFLSTAPVISAQQDPFKDANAMRVSGPIVLSREQLERIGEAISVPSRDKFN